MFKANHAKVSSRNTILINPVSVVKTLCAIAIVLVFLSVMGQIALYVFDFNSFSGLIAFFDLNREENLPTLFSTLILLASAFLLLTISALNA